MANNLIDAIDPDEQQAAIEQAHGPAATPEQEQAVIAQLTDTACQPLDAAPVRNLLKDLKQKSDIVIDEVTVDTVRSAGFDLAKSREKVQSFRDFIEANRDEITALQIIYNQAYGQQRLTYAAIRELAQKLGDPPHYLTTADVWQAYKRLNEANVRGAPVDRQLTEIVSLVRYALGQDAVLEPFADRVRQRFNLWIGREKNAGREYSAEQMEWLGSIAAFIAANAEIAPRDFMEAPELSGKGGIVKARQVFGAGLNDILDDLQGALVA